MGGGGVKGLLQGIPIRATIAWHKAFFKGVKGTKIG